jgi:hypothetical protein
MHSAPAVRYPVPRSARAGRVLAALCAMPVLPFAIGWMSGGVSAAALTAIGAIWLVAGSVAVAQWRGMQAGQLRWDGQTWWWHPGPQAHADEHAVSIELRLDLQAAVLVRMVGAPNGVCWRWLDRTVAPGLWGDLRRALCQRGAARPTLPEPQR